MSFVANRTFATITTAPFGVAMAAGVAVAAPMFQNQPVVQPGIGGFVS